MPIPEKRRDVKISSLVQSCIVLSSVDRSRVEILGTIVSSGILCVEVQRLHLVDLMLIFIHNFAEHSTKLGFCKITGNHDKELLKFEIEIADPHMDNLEFNECVRRINEGLEIARSSNATQLASGEDRSGLLKAQMLIDQFWKGQQGDFLFESYQHNHCIVFKFSLPGEIFYHANNSH